MLFAFEDLTGWAALIGSVTALIVAIAKVYANARRAFQLAAQRAEENTRHAAEQSARTDLLWRAHIRRATLGAASKGIAQMSGPTLTITSRPVREAYDLIAPRLRALYQRLGRGLDDSKFAELIEKYYGDLIVRHICDPLGLNEFECLAMAVAVAREDETSPPGDS